VGPAGFRPATKRIQAQLQSGYNLFFKKIAAVNIANMNAIPVWLHFQLIEWQL
jgi:hypothetical protein